MRSRTHAWWMPCLVLIATGCQVTGDPRQGGIFWNEEKAIERQRALEQRRAATQTELDAVRGRQAINQGERDRLVSENRVAQAHLATLQAEHDRLAARLKSLMSSEAANKAKVAAVRKRLETGAMGPAPAKGTAEAGRVRELDASIRRLNEEILFMLEP